MITEFDKNCAVALYKREFAERLKDDDYEGALDRLLKYSEATENPDFHLACGMLYLVMSQSSDDREFLTLAYREFMAHIRRFPDCTAAYRNLLATAYLRREPNAMIACDEFLKSRGQNLKSIVSELAEVGIAEIMGGSEYVFIEELFQPGEYGAIDPVAVAPEDNDRRQARSESDGENKSSKIIKFRGAQSSELAADGGKDKRGATDKLDAGDPMFDFLKMAKMFSDDENGEPSDDEQTFDDEEESFDVDEMFINDLNDVDLPTELRARVALRTAEHYCDKGDYDAALNALDKIGVDDRHLYYCGECVRAFILLENERFAEAERAIGHALGVHPDGALAGTLLCNLYEIQRKFSEIPAALKAIAVDDFIDADHVYKAARLAIKYCDPDDALDLLEDYIDEFNILDVRQLYAQLLYNSGDREDAIAELYDLTRVLYDDFNVRYYYLMAKSGADELPIGEEAPQQALSIIVDNIAGAAAVGVIDDDMIANEAFRLGLEVFLTLEYRNDRKTTVAMFDTVRRLAANVKLDGIMRDALVSPYVEPIVKSVILSELLKRGGEFTASVAYCPISSDSVPALKNATVASRVAYAFVLTLDRRKINEFIEKTDELASALSDADETESSVRDIAYYLIRTVMSAARRNGYVGDRIEYALGYPTKSAANAAYKAVSVKLNGGAK
ncbi:MAG: tetratricopeptide repeat protein [Clostridiales bacterium]|nr:tetratricopeptide repeat protein [Clostridiales bacterium]